MAQSTSKILSKMLERLFASLLSGPALNCRPHSSRQRIDFTALSRLKDITPEQALRNLLSAERKTKLTARVSAPPKRLKIEGEEGPSLTPEEKAAQQPWTEQQALLKKLHIIVDDARTYEQDTGVGVLSLGFPLLTLPPSALGKVRGGFNRRIIAPIAFIPVALTVRQGPTPTGLSQGNGATGAGSGGTNGSAPVGHRQPRPGDVPDEKNVTNIDAGDAALDRAMRGVCRGC